MPIANKVTPVGILGGGLAGVALQHFLRRESEVLEKEARPGGLCRAWKVDGVTADRGPHIIFSRDGSTVREMVGILGKNVCRLYRRNAIWYGGRYIAYPFENGLAALDLKTRLRCLRGYLFQRAAGSEVRNLEDWAYRAFGPALARAYFLPYNEKIWKRSARDLGLDWVERIPRPGLIELIKGTAGLRTEGYRHQLYFHHPKKGGIEALVKVLIKDPRKIRTNSRVIRIEKNGKLWQVTTESGKYRYEHVVCCLPLQELIPALGEKVPASIRQAVGKLRVNSVILVLMAYPSSRPPERFAVYIPDRAILPHRISWVNYLGPDLVPVGYHAVLAEISSRPGDECSQMEDKQIALRTVRQLQAASLLPAEVSVESRVCRQTYGYVVNTLDSSRARKTVVGFCRNLDIPLLGRWAEFEYLNMDAVWQRAKSLAAELDRKRGTYKLAPPLAGQLMTKHE